MLIALVSLSVWGQTQSIKINNSGSSTIYYKKIGFLDSSNGELRINGILGAHTPTQGKSTIDITFSARDRFIAHGQIDGKSPNSYIILVQNGTGAFGDHYNVYLRYGAWAQVDFNIIATGYCQVNDEEASSLNPGTVFWSSHNFAKDISTTTFVNGIKVNGDISTIGKITAEEILVEAGDNTADFVFEPDYKLRDLTEVENYILTNKHLPDIPSAAQMEEEGVNLAEMNKLLLQKVEELTLYQIEKEKEVKEIKEARRREQGEREKLKKALSEEQSARSEMKDDMSLIKKELQIIKDYIKK